MTKEQVKAIVTVAIAHAKACDEWVDEENLGLFWETTLDLSVVFFKTIRVPATGGTGPNNEQETVSSASFEEIYRTLKYKNKNLEAAALELFEDVQGLV